MTRSAILVADLTHRYGDRVAIDALSLDIPPAQVFGLLGPNGSGKTTLFRILSTLIPPQHGEVRVLGLELPRQQTELRRQIGVVFQSPGLDRQLTAAENLLHQGHLYGLRGSALRRRIDELLEQFDLRDRANERVERFSGGMRRRVELAKGMLHRPQLLLLDEPSTGLDPRARHELMQHLRQIQQREQTGILLTTHLMEEAEQCDALAIMDRGRKVAQATPEKLKQMVGGDVITLHSPRPVEIARRLRESLNVLAQPLGDNALRIEHARGHELLADIFRACPDGIDAVSVGKPTLLDVYIHLTGRRFEAER